MPLGQLRQYSTATGALRKNPSLPYTSGTNYLDQHFKLMFVYPMLFEEKTSKFQASGRDDQFESYENIIRNFISASFLREIFISNTVDVVSMASQIRPLRDEEGGRVDTTSVVGDYYRGETEVSRRYIDQAYRAEVEAQLKHKIGTLKRLLKVDPQMAPLNPQVDMVVLQNLVEVPVITGTKPFKISSADMFYVLVAAIALNKPLNSEQNLNQIFAAIRSLKEKDFWQLLNRLVPPPENPDRKSFLERLRTRSRVRAQSMNLVGGQDKTISVPQAEAGGMLRYLQQRLKMTEINFKMMLNPSLLRTRTGIDISTGQMAGVITRVNPERNAILSDMETRVMQSFSTIGNSALRSFANIYHPADTDLDYVREHRTMLGTIHGEIHDAIRGNLYACIDASLTQQSHEGMLQQTKSLKTICSTLTDKVKRVRSEFKESLQQVSITSTVFNLTDYSRFLSNLERISSTASGLRANMESAFDDILDCGEAFNQIRNAIDTGIRNLFQTYQGRMDDNDHPPSITVAVAAANYNTDPYTVEHIGEYIRQARRSLNEIYQFLFFYEFTNAFCKMVDILDVEVTTSQTDVTEWPNYTLVIPIEMMSALNAALLAKGWNNLVQPGQEGRPNVMRTSEDDVKKMIKFLSSKLDVPNLIVIDRKKGVIFTKLMHHSQVVRMNLRVLNTFVKEMENIRANYAL